MPVIVLEAGAFTSPLFLVRTWEVLSGCTTFSLVASLKQSNNNSSDHHRHPDTLRIFCMSSWCFFFTLTLLIHALSVLQVHNLVPVSWKNLTVTAAVSGALMSLSAAAVFPCVVVADRQRVTPRLVAAIVASCLTFLAYASESYVLRAQASELRGYMGSMPGLLKVVPVWGGCTLLPLVVEQLCGPQAPAHDAQLLVYGVMYGVCFLMSLVTLVVILGDFAGRCFLPFDKLLVGFSLIGVLLYALPTVICFIKVLGHSLHPELLILEAVVSSLTLLAYTVDLALSIKLMCCRSSMCCL
ncbi:Myeloid-associated differentiation marker [Liparis tanakae]|uniref:Myeloid-associated differentiation marker n=1 Tax=Liparis tanakae TaxID=230148 RepID=A0A4Z2F8B4_9TELE|nr:Myeloid-associated differentiation marker [Liparis tanakae]